MNKNLQKIFLALLLLAGVSLSERAMAQYNQNGYNNGYYGDDVYDDGSSYQQFYDDLSPYGNWYYDGRYGYVWSPNAGSDFRPYYSNGYWQMTNYGNTWISNYSWGWAPFHYGRWTYDNYYGWVWIPGNVWGPAWVSWRHGGGNYGWCPLGPGVNVSVSFGGWNAPSFWWSFVPQRYVYHHGFQHYSYAPSYNNTYINNTTVINNTYVTNNYTYVTGPDRRDVERATGRSVNVLQVSDARQPGRGNVRGNAVAMYRPEIRTATRNEVARPKRVATPNPRSGIAQNTAPDRGRNSAIRGGDVRNANAIDRNATPRPDRGAMQANPGVRTNPRNAAPTSTPRATDRQPVQSTPRNYGQQQQPVRQAEPVRTMPDRTAPVQRSPQRNYGQQQPVRQPEPVRSQPVQQAPAPRNYGQQQPNRQPVRVQQQPRYDNRNAQQPVRATPTPRAAQPAPQPDRPRMSSSPAPRMNSAPAQRADRSPSPAPNRGGRGGDMPMRR